MLALLLAYLPLPPEYVNFLLTHIRMFHFQSWPDIGLEILQEFLFPQPEGLGVMTTDILDALDDKCSL